MASAAGHKTAAKGKTRDAADSGRAAKRQNRLACRRWPAPP